MWLGIHVPERVDKLILCSTAAKIGTAEMWDTRIVTVEKEGMKPVAAAAIERWFTAGFREKNPAEVAATKKVLEAAKPEGYAACCAAVRDFDFRGKVSGIRVPALAIAGAYDSATPPADLRSLAEHISGARYAEISGAHLCNIEDASHFTAEVDAFLEV